jgi:ArsR family transcriptional regulator, arsenate/arsenite/antimonite-responsive transcriptional repressor
VARQRFEVVEERSGRASEPGEAAREERVTRLVALGRALSDPIRVQMLETMAAVTFKGRGCCDLPDLGVPAGDEDENIGVCVCEFVDYYGMGQSKVSYHLGKLKEAGLVQEKKRGKWSFYSLDREAARQLLAEAVEQLGSPTPVLTGAAEDGGHEREA